MNGPRGTAIKELVKLGRNTPNRGCPALRIRFADGQNLVEKVFNWLYKATEKFVVPKMQELKVLVA